MPTKKDSNIYLVKKQFSVKLGLTLYPKDKLVVKENNVYRSEEFIMTFKSFQFFNKKYGFAK